MTRHLICLVSRQLVPNDQLLKHFKPDGVWRLVTHDSLQFDRPLRDTISHHLGQPVRLPDPYGQMVEPHWLLPSHDAVAGLVGAPPPHRPAHRVRLRELASRLSDEAAALRILDDWMSA